MPFDEPLHLRSELVVANALDIPGLVSETDISPPRGNPFPVVGIGASAGGLEAFGQLLSALPPDTGMVFVLIQHLDPQHESSLVELLRPQCPMPVVTVENGMAIQPNTVYVIPPNASLVLKDGHLELSPRESGLHLPVDIFFQSLALVQGSRAIGVVLSGNASDGSNGVRAIKAECGLTFAQSETTARFGGMPRSAISTGAIDFILSPQEIGQELAALAHHPFLLPRQKYDSTTETLPDDDDGLRRIFSILQSKTRVDFSTYKITTVRRRIGRRMMVRRTPTLGQYVQLVEQNREEVQELYRDLLISVTSFFRDPKIFQALYKIVESDLLLRLPSNRSLRVWVPGCATGEEVYSIAIVLREIFARHQFDLSLQIFGTDISEGALAKARLGIYADSAVANLSPEQLNRYFVKTASSYQVAKVIRESCIFARHDVIRDPPFSHLDMISCRNVLIYLDSTQHRRVLPLFHYGLKENGLLILGTAETVSSSEDLFSQVMKSQQIYRRNPAPARVLSVFDVATLPPAAAATFSSERKMVPVTVLDLQRRVDRIIQNRFSPDAVLVNRDLEILQFRGHVSTYLTSSSGEASLNLLRMVHESLVVPLRRACRVAIDGTATVFEPATLAMEGSRPIELEIQAIPIAGTSNNDRFLLVVFRPSMAKSEGLSSLPPQLQADEQVAGLTEELAEMREYLRNLTEGYEAHAEELRAANEEARSANEELQSSNEELGTTKEELQSTNEELTTVNEELEHRNKELHAINSDLKNLLGAVSLAILMVDHDLRLRRFNFAAESLLSLTPLDVGRPVAHLRCNIETPMLEEQSHRVIESLIPFSQELQAKDGRWYTLAIRPYRTMDDHIAGVVITIQDIDRIKRALQSAEEARDYAEGVIKTVREPLVVLDADLRVLRATSAFFETFQVSREETEGRFLYDLGNGQWNRSRLRELLGLALFRQQPFHDYEFEHDFPHIGRRTVRLNGQRIPLPDLQNRMLLLAIEDMTERRDAAEIRFQRLFETAKDGIVVIDRETGLVSDVNPYFLELAGLQREDIIYVGLNKALPLCELDDLLNSISTLAPDKIIRLTDRALRRKDGSEVCVDIVGSAYLVGTQEVIQLNIRDITDAKQAARELRQSEQRFRLFVESVRDYALFQLDPNGVIDTWTSGAERLLGWSEEEAVGKRSEIVFSPEDRAAGIPNLELQQARTLGRAEDERWHVRKDGSFFFASGVLTPVCEENGTLRGFAKVMRDVTDRRQSEDRLKQQAALLDLAHDAIIVRQLDGRILFWNRGAEVLYGWSTVEAVGQIAHQLLRATFTEPLGTINSKLLRTGHWDGEVTHKDQVGRTMIVASRWALQHSGPDQPARILEINTDITATREQEEVLQRSVEEKSMLVREIHHRVKNNLQVIVSLLSLQSNYIRDPQVTAAFEETESRVRAIAQIHERLYASDDLTEVEFAGYLTHLAQELVSLYGQPPNQIHLDLNLQEMVLHIEQAIPLGLISNELIINSLKHGVSSGKGTLTVELSYIPEPGASATRPKTLDEGWAQVRVRDSGSGLPANLDWKNSPSLGFRLVTLLVRQIRGVFEIGPGPGANISIAFPLHGTQETPSQN